MAKLHKANESNMDETATPDFEVTKLGIHEPDGDGIIEASVSEFKLNESASISKKS